MYKQCIFEGVVLCFYWKTADCLFDINHTVSSQSQPFCTQGDQNSNLDQSSFAHISIYILCRYDKLAKFSPSYRQGRKKCRIKGTEKWFLMSISLTRLSFYVNNEDPNINRFYFLCQQNLEKTLETCLLFKTDTYNMIKRMLCFFLTYEYTSMCKQTCFSLIFYIIWYALIVVLQEKVLHSQHDKPWSYLWICMRWSRIFCRGGGGGPGTTARK